VERTRGPILLVSGGDDAMWDSTRLADIAVDRAAAHGKHDVTHLRYPAAGHQISVPGAPTLASAAHPVHKATLALGGTPDANDAASSDSWPQVVAFLLEHG
jgi:dienelactone hydrolase